MINPIPLVVAFALTVAVVPAPVRAQHAWSSLSPDMQIRLAVQAGPAEMREEATVQGYDASGAFVTLREGSNDLVCMAPDPGREDFEVSCHHQGLEAYFVRGRELRDAGIVGQERTQKRWDEFTAGALPIPYGSVNYILHGTGFDAGSGEITEPYLRWTIYTPNATPESTGITTVPSTGGPWLMFPGTPGSHIMITPPRGGGQ
ncbi:MAG: hypothetical protein P8170_10250 [Gemmatimonadota bacterium]